MISGEALWVHCGQWTKGEGGGCYALPVRAVKNQLHRPIHKLQPANVNLAIERKPDRKKEINMKNAVNGQKEGEKQRNMAKNTGKAEENNVLLSYFTERNTFRD